MLAVLSRVLDPESAALRVRIDGVLRLLATEGGHFGSIRLENASRRRSFYI